MFPALVTGAFAILLRLPLISRSELSGDESVFGLMAFAIARGEEYPLYCWGAHYASALISYLSIPFMAWYGPSPFSFRLPTLLYDAVLAPLVFLSLRRAFDTFNSYLAAMAMAASLPTMFLLSTTAHGGYPETYCLGFAIWIMCIAASRSLRSRDFLAAGFLMGASFMILWLGLPFLISGLVLLLWKRSLHVKGCLSMCAGFMAGSLPFWIYNLSIAPGATFRRLGGRSLDATAQSNLWDAMMGRVGQVPQWIMETMLGLSNLFSPCGGLAGAVILLGLAVWGGVLLHRQGSEWGILVLSFLVALLLFNLAGNLTRDRQWTTVAIALVVAVQAFGKYGARCVLIPLVVVSLYADVRMIAAFAPHPVVGRAADIILRAGADGLYADYDLGYPIGFRLLGRIPVSATMPPNSSDRRPVWTEQLRRAERPAVLLPDDANTRNWERLLVARNIDFASHDLDSRILFVVYKSLPPDLVPLAPKSPSR